MVQDKGSLIANQNSYLKFQRDLIGNAVMLNSLLNEELKKVQDMKEPKMNVYQFKLANTALRSTEIVLSKISNIDTII